jgi:hypothetical protein
MRLIVADDGVPLRGVVNGVSAYRGASMPLPPGDDGTVRTLRVMRQLVRAGREHADIRMFAHSIVGDAGNSPEALARMLFAFMRERFVYTPDPHGTEHVTAPWALLRELARAHAAGKSGGGRVGVDCDDNATFGACVLEALDIPAAFVVVAREPAGNFQHVFYAGHIGGAWVPFDPQELPTPGTWPTPLPGRVAIVRAI